VFGNCLWLSVGGRLGFGLTVYVMH
jgi:hypothetical protein